MIKLTYCFIALFTLTTATAQTNKGDKLVGGSIGGLSFNSSNQNTTYTNTATTYDYKSSSFNINVAPNVMWFIKDNLAIGGTLSVGYGSSSSKNSNSTSTQTSDGKFSSPNVYIGPSVRMYFGESNKAKPFVQGDVGFGINPSTSSTKYSTGQTYDYKTKVNNSIMVGLGIGYEQFITPNVGVFGIIGFAYKSSKYTTDNTSSVNSAYSYTSTTNGISVPLNIGVQIHIAGKK